MTEPLTDTELLEIEKRVKCAAPGPWHWRYKDDLVVELSTQDEVSIIQPEFVPRLLAEVYRLRKELECPVEAGQPIV